MEIVFNDLQTRVICSCLYRDPSFSSVHRVRNFKLSLVCFWLRPQAAPCLRGDKSAENHFTTETQRTLRTQWDLKLGQHPKTKSSAEDHRWSYKRRSSRSPP